MRRSNLDQLLSRYVTDQVSAQERIKIEAWLDVKKTKGTDLELSEEDEERLFQKITSNLDNVDEIVAFNPGGNKLRSLIGNTWLRIAASVLLLGVIFYTVRYSVNSGKIPGGGEIGASKIEKLILNDGTIVWLHEGGKLVYTPEPTTGLRHAELSGEALFEVAKDPAHPFIISCGQITVKVIGTSFNLKTENGQIELRVLTGMVNLSSPKDSQGINVERNERAVYSGSGVLERTKIAGPELVNAAAGTEYDMSFRNAKMQSVLERIHYKFEVNVSVANSELNQCRITADFTDRSLEVTLQMISDLLDVQYKINGKDIAVSGKGCQ